MPEDTLVYVFYDNHGRCLATIDPGEASYFVTETFENQNIEEMTLGQLYARDPKALVRARAQYYWAVDLMTGHARGRQS